MSETEVQKIDGTLSMRVGDYTLELPFTRSNQKLLVVIARLFRKEGSSRSCFSYQAISEGLGHGNRQWSHNYYREFLDAKSDCFKFLKREYKSYDAELESIHHQIQEAPFLDVESHRRLFLEKHPDCGISKSGFLTCARQIDGVALLRCVRRLVDAGTLKLKHKFYLQEILKRGLVSEIGRAEISSLFPGEEEEFQETQQKAPRVPAPLQENVRPSQEPEQKSSGDLTPRQAQASWLQKAKLVCFLYAGGLSMEILATLFMVCKGTIHNWVYKFASVELETSIQDSICRWSGRVSFDDKWIKIKGVWWFVFCAVDDVTGFPLLLRLFPANDGLSWQLFFTEFKALYGAPVLMISDGCQSLAAGKKMVFSWVVHQLCKFHKLRNLFKRMFRYIKDQNLLRRCLRLAKNIFSNGYVSSRKYAAKTLARVAPEEVKEYVEKNILKHWRKLSRSLTSNSAERFNRKIEKCFSGRYGIKSEKSAQVLLRGLWFKECVMRGQQHLASLDEFDSKQLAEICQETMLSPGNLHFLGEEDAIIPKKAA